MSDSVPEKRPRADDAEHTDSAKLLSFQNSALAQRLKDKKELISALRQQNDQLSARLDSLDTFMARFHSEWSKLVADVLSLCSGFSGSCKC